jgi:hypothetical protein
LTGLERGRASEFIATYGERGYYLLRAILEAARELVGRGRLGDFDYKTVKRKLREMGLDYNPSLLLSRLEKEYGLIETTYRSGGQHWWRILDIAEIEDAIAEYEGRPPLSESLSDPRVRLLRLQFYALEPMRLLERLERLSRRRGREAQRAFRDIVFRELPGVAEFLSKVREEGLEEELAPEAALAERILEAAEKIALRLGLIPVARSPLGGLEEPALRGGVGEPG